MKKILILLLCVCTLTEITAQRHTTDSLRALLLAEKRDTARVLLLWNLSVAYNSNNPDSARWMAQEALFLAEKIHFIDGESKALGALANTFNQVSNYPRALEFYLRKLKIEEQRNSPQDMASAVLNIGSVYGYLEEYDKAFDYYYRADSIMKTNPAGDKNYGDILRYSINLNIGDLYSRVNRLDSANIYFYRSLALAVEQQNGDFTGTSMVGLGEVALKLKKYDAAGFHLRSALPYLEKARNEDLLCETYWGLANLHDSLQHTDSARFYASRMLSLARQDGFLRWELKAADFLTAFYRKNNRIDSAYTYLLLAGTLRDSISGIDKIRTSQIISGNEQIRQAELAEQKRLAAAERKQQLQFLFIAIFIPAFFLITFFLSRRRIHIRVIEFMGILSLLILFEFLTLLLHPWVAEKTHHTPVLELLVFVAVAAILIPAHHRIEHWLVKKLTARKKHPTEGRLHVKKVRMKMKKPPENE
ncbi:MAG: hypothetical protein U0X40_05285 [Ferruginibacter sp.]